MISITDVAVGIRTNTVTCSMWNCGQMLPSTHLDLKPACNKDFVNAIPKLYSMICFIMSRSEARHAQVEIGRVRSNPCFNGWFHAT